MSPTLQGIFEHTVSDLEALCAQHKSNKTGGSSSGDEPMPSYSLAFSVGMGSIGMSTASLASASTDQIPVQVLSARLATDLLEYELTMPPRGKVSITTETATRGR
eukprot:2069983-Pyramimonas_sp.AAC.1